jgi:hypothetical protein
MRRALIATLIAAALIALPATALAAQKTGCAAAESGWHAVLVTQAAADFFPHLTPGQFTSAEEFAEVIDALYDGNGDDMACIKLMWGWELNPNSHWYRLGFALGLDEPVHVMMVIDNTANGS